MRETRRKVFRERKREREREQKRSKRNSVHDERQWSLNDSFEGSANLTDWLVHRRMQCAREGERRSRERERRERGESGVTKSAKCCKCVEWSERKIETKKILVNCRFELSGSSELDATPHDKVDTFIGHFHCNSSLLFSVNGTFLCVSRAHASNCVSNILPSPAKVTATF